MRIHCIGKSHVTYDQLGTLLIEIESIINSRPLTTCWMIKTELREAYVLHILLMEGD